MFFIFFFFFFQAEDGIRDLTVTGVQTCALPILGVAMLLFFVMIKLPLSLLTMIIAHTIFNFPVVALIVRARLRKLDPRLEEAARDLGATPWVAFKRSEEHTSELQSQSNLVCRLLLEKKKKHRIRTPCG